MAAHQGGERFSAFIVTREHRRFTEFADAVRKHRYIGVCHGPAGVGKTLSARRYARWDVAETLLIEWGPREEESDAKVHAALASSRAVFYTPTVGLPLRELRQDLPRLISRTDICIDEHIRPEGASPSRRRTNHVELIIIDEAERLSTTALEYLRDLFDRKNIGMILIGMPGIDKRLSRYPQLFSRVGFAHAYRPLQNEELTFVLTRRWRQLGIELDDADFSDAQAVATIVRITGGNFRLVQRLFVQIERILRLNGRNSVTDDVVEAARSVLVIGAT
jgi:DNA transposition AAA+ family ATPase